MLQEVTQLYLIEVGATVHFSLAVYSCVGKLGKEEAKPRFFQELMGHREAGLPHTLVRFHPDWNRRSHACDRTRHTVARLRMCDDRNTGLRIGRNIFLLCGDNDMKADSAGCSICGNREPVFLLVEIGGGDGNFHAQAVRGQDQREPKTERDEYKGVS